MDITCQLDGIPDRGWSCIVITGIHSRRPIAIINIDSNKLEKYHWQPEVCWKSTFFPVQIRYCIFYTGNYFVVFWKTKQSSHKHLRVVPDITFIWGEHQVVNHRDVVLPRENHHPRVYNFRCLPHVKAMLVMHCCNCSVRLSNFA
jgi:hypothetical protein